MGVFHQGGVIEMQMQLGEHWVHTSGGMPGVDILWWRTYSPPVWLLNAPPAGPFITDLMGMPASEVLSLLQNKTLSPGSEAWLVAPHMRREIATWAPEVAAWNQWNSRFDDSGVVEGFGDMVFKLPGVTRSEIITVSRHIGLDDLDIPEDGLWGTLVGLIEKRGLTAWRFRRGSGSQAQKIPQLEE